MSGGHKTPGARVAAARAGRGFSQSELARAAQISRQALVQIETGGALPRVDTAVRIAQTLGTDVESLFAKDVETDIPVIRQGMTARPGVSQIC